ncbi:hypothetical protein PFISCL1PPCAC_2816, partial [Pristionchus fissidentatus]
LAMKCIDSRSFSVKDVKITGEPAVLASLWAGSPNNLATLVRNGKVYVVNFNLTRLLVGTRVSNRIFSDFVHFPPLISSSQHQKMQILPEGMMTNFKPSSLLLDELGFHWTQLQTNSEETRRNYFWSEFLFADNKGSVPSFKQIVFDEENPDILYLDELSLDTLVITRKRITDTVGLTMEGSGRYFSWQRIILGRRLHLLQYTRNSGTEYKHNSRHFV